MHAGKIPESEQMKTPQVAGRFLINMRLLAPKKSLSQADIKKGLHMVIWDGLAAEVMTSFTSGTFLVAVSLLLGANNFQIGLLSSMPLFNQSCAVIFCVAGLEIQQPEGCCGLLCVSGENTVDPGCHEYTLVLAPAGIPG